MSTNDGGTTWQMDFIDDFISKGSLLDLGFNETGQGYATGYHGLLVKAQTSVGIQEEENEKHLRIYPNPVSDHLTVKSGKFIKRLQLYNNEGALLFDKEYNNAVVTIGLGEYPIGIYFVKVFRGEEVVGKKMLMVE